MTSSLVGSEMCIRDRHSTTPRGRRDGATLDTCGRTAPRTGDEGGGEHHPCLLYTSDAADDM
eukprot:6878154-Prorocentrum_lima.AAC.1